MKIRVLQKKAISALIRLPPSLEGTNAGAQHTFSACLSFFSPLICSPNLRIRSYLNLLLPPSHCAEEPDPRTAIEGVQALRKNLEPPLKFPIFQLLQKSILGGRDTSQTSAVNFST